MSRMNPFEVGKQEQLDLSKVHPQVIKLLEFYVKKFRAEVSDIEIMRMDRIYKTYIHKRNPGVTERAYFSLFYYHVVWKYSSAKTKGFNIDEERVKLWVRYVGSSDSYLKLRPNIYRPDIL